MKRLFLTIIMQVCIVLLISNPISIVPQSYNGMTKDAYVSLPNSAGGVNVKIMFKNTSDKTIKYIYINCTPYNAVDDVVPCSIRGYKVLDLSITGPIEPNTGNIPEYMWKYLGNLDYNGVYLAEFENVWYNSTIKYAVVDKIEIVYMDNSREVLTKPFHHIFLLNIIRQ